MCSRDPITPDRATESSLRVLAPADQPNTVHEIAERLLSAYTVEGGTVRLAGCLLEDRPFLRVTATGVDPAVEFFLDGDGNDVSPDVIEALGMRETIELDLAPEQTERTIPKLARLARQRVASLIGEPDSRREFELAAIWCKFAEGKLRFTIGEHSTDLGFAGWARTLEPPPVPCFDSATTSYHLAALDDGRLVAAESVAVCEESGRRVLDRELATCSATHRRVLPEFIETCPVSGESVLRTEMVSCEICRQSVSPATARHGVCEACDRMEAVSKADPRLARVLDEYPSLERWRRWRLAESATAYHLTARRWFRRLLLLVDKDSLEMKLVATGRCMRSGWDAVEPSYWEFILRV